MTQHSVRISERMEYEKKKSTTQGCYGLGHSFTCQLFEYEKNYVDFIQVLRLFILGTAFSPKMLSSLRNVRMPALYLWARRRTSYKVCFAFNIFLYNIYTKILSMVNSKIVIQLCSVPLVGGDVRMSNLVCPNVKKLVAVESFVI